MKSFIRCQLVPDITNSLTRYSIFVMVQTYKGADMRIYAVADIHGKPDRIALIRENLNEIKPDALVVAGDITNYANCKAVIEQFRRMPAPVLAIRGNTDPPKVSHLLEDAPNITSLHLKKHKINEIVFVGAGGTIPVPFDSRMGFREKKTLKILAALIDEKSVLVTHPPPRGILDEAFGRFHAGCRRLRQLVLQHRPKLLLCGHIHEWPGVACLGTTQVVNCCMTGTSGGALVEFDADGIPKVEMI